MALLALLTAVFPVAAGMLVGGLSGLCTLTPQGRTRWLWEGGCSGPRWEGKKMGGRASEGQPGLGGVGCLEDKGGNIDFRD